MITHGTDYFCPPPSFWALGSRISAVRLCHKQNFESF
nr:MAG TPA: hypothetical protein [Caudoviricetes sp.]